MCVSICQSASLIYFSFSLSLIPRSLSLLSHPHSFSPSLTLSHSLCPRLSPSLPPYVYLLKSMSLSPCLSLSLFLSLSLSVCLTSSGLACSKDLKTKGIRTRSSSSSRNNTRISITYIFVRRYIYLCKYTYKYHGTLEHVPFPPPGKISVYLLHIYICV